MGQSHSSMRVGGQVSLLDYFALQRNLLHSGENEPCLLLSSHPLFKGSPRFEEPLYSLSLSLSLFLRLYHT